MQLKTLSVLLMITSMVGCTNDPPEPPDLLPPSELPIRIVPQFTCLTEAGTEMDMLADVPGMPGSRFSLRANGGACNYDFLFREGTRETQLSIASSGYLLTTAALTTAGDIAACVANIAHHPIDGELHGIDGVTVECAIRRGDTWTALSTVVDSRGEWAGWPRAIVERDDGTLALRYAHDFSFQFINMSDNGRPEEDGIYEVDLRVESGRVVAGETVKVSDQVNPLNNLTSGQWTPTEEEMERLDHIDFGDESEE